MIEKTPTKQRRERSKAYPGASLEECVNYIRAIKKNLGKGAHDRESLSKAMGFEKLTGGVLPRIAALVYFGFLDRVEGGYELSSNAQRITDPLSDAEKSEELRAAFKRPTLYEEILEKFEQDGQIPVQLSTHLHRFHGITDAASGTAAEIFLESGRFAGVLDQSNRLLLNDIQSKSREEAVTKNESVVESDLQSKVGDGQPVHPVTDAKQRTETNPSAQRFEFSITGGRTAVIVVPSDINEKDIRIIRKQIELLELQAGIENDNKTS